MKNLTHPALSHSLPATAVALIVLNLLPIQAQAQETEKPPVSTAEARTQAFYSEAIQELLKGNPSWDEIVQNVNTVAQELQPESFKNPPNPFDKLSPSEKEIYKKAFEAAATDPSIQKLRDAAEQNPIQHRILDGNPHTWLPRSARKTAITSIKNHPI